MTKFEAIVIAGFGPIFWGRWVGRASWRNVLIVSAALIVLVLVVGCNDSMPDCTANYTDPGPAASLGLVTTDPDILPQAQCAAARWTNATGIAIRAGERSDGRNVELRWWPGSATDHDMLGEYLPDTRTILIKDTLPGKFVFPATVAHEAGHAIEDSAEHIAPTADGLMTPNDLEDPPITMADLKLICGQAKCERERVEQ